MFDKILEKITGKDDLERVACLGNFAKLSAYLKTRKVYVPRKPRRFLDPSELTETALLDHIKAEARESANTPFEPWILDLDGKKRLPVFSSPERMQQFSAKISVEINKVFSLVAGEALLEVAIKGLELDFVDLNLFCQKSWEIEVKKKSAS